MHVSSSLLEKVTPLGKKGSGFLRMQNGPVASWTLPSPMFWLPKKDSSVYAMIDGHGCFLLEEFSPSHNPSYLSLNSQFPDRIGLGCALHEVRNTGEECV